MTKLLMENSSNRILDISKERLALKRGVVEELFWAWADDPVWDEIRRLLDAREGALTLEKRREKRKRVLNDGSA